MRKQKQAAEVTKEREDEDSRVDRDRKCEPPQCHSTEESHWWLHFLEQFPESIWQTDYGYCWLLSSLCEGCLCPSSCPQLTEGVTGALPWRDALPASLHVCSREHQALSLLSPPVSWLWLYSSDFAMGLFPLLNRVFFWSDLNLALKHTLLQ